MSELASEPSNTAPAPRNEAAGSASTEERGAGLSVINPPSREDVVEMLATYGPQQPDQVAEDIGSLERAWLIHQVEQRYGLELELNDDQVVRITTVTDAVSVLAEVLAGEGNG